MKTSKCWVWFKGSLNNGGFWKEGFTCTFDERPGVLIESPAYVTCRVPTWRILTREPENLSKALVIIPKLFSNSKALGNNVITSKLKPLI